MHGEGVLVVLINWKRPANLPTVIRAWRGQTVEPRWIVVVDNSPALFQEEYPQRMLDDADDVWRLTENLGCPCRFAPALMLMGYRHVLFADDDVLPGSRALEALLEAADKLEDRFATLGGLGRAFLLDEPEGRRYSGTSTALRRHDRPVRTDLTCQVHLFRSDLAVHAMTFRANLLARFGAEAAGLCAVHDDFQLCLGLQAGTGLPSYLVPTETDAERRLVKEYLPGANDTTACWKRPTHFQERNRMVDMALACGWRSLT